MVFGRHARPSTAQLGVVHGRELLVHCGKRLVESDADPPSLMVGLHKLLTMGFIRVRPIRGLRLKHPVLDPLYTTNKGR
jgi:hypothetical protein